MKTATKRISSYLFILLGFVPLLFALLITLKKRDIHDRMKEELKQRTLETVVLPEHEVIWMDKHEIWVNEQMFDISSIKLENGIYTFTGLYDEKETLLVNHEKDMGSKSAKENKLLTQLFKCLHNIFCKEQSENRFVTEVQNNRNNFLFPETVAQFREILTPPPQVLAVM